MHSRSHAPTLSRSTRWGGSLRGHARARHASAQVPNLITFANLLCGVAALLFYRDFWSPRLVALLTLGLAVLMVSHLRFPKFPAIAGRLPRPAQLLALLFLLAASLLVPLWTVIVALGLSYYVGSLLENLGFWEAVADGPVGDVVERLRARL